jgi:hypothetical protein
LDPPEPKSVIIPFYWPSISAYPHIFFSPAYIQVCIIIITPQHVLQFLSSFLLQTHPRRKKINSLNHTILNLQATELGGRKTQAHRLAYFKCMMTFLKWPWMQFSSSDTFLKLLFYSFSCLL